MQTQLGRIEKHVDLLHVLKLFKLSCFTMNIPFIAVNITQAVVTELKTAHQSFLFLLLGANRIYEMKADPSQKGLFNLEMGRWY